MSNTQKQTIDITGHLEHLIDLVNSDEWSKGQDDKLVQGIKVALSVINNMTTGVNEFLEAFYGYVEKVSNNSLVGIGVDSNGYNAPTQTSANRATRRARAKKK